MELSTGTELHLRAHSHRAKANAKAKIPFDDWNFSLISSDCSLIFFAFAQCEYDLKLLLRADKAPFTSFPAIHKIDNAGIFIQLLKEIDCKQFKSRYTFVNVLWIIIEATDFYIHRDFKFKQ